MANEITNIPKFTTQVRIGADQIHGMIDFTDGSNTSGLGLDDLLKGHIKNSIYDNTKAAKEFGATYFFTTDDLIMMIKAWRENGKDRGASDEDLNLIKEALFPKDN